MAEHQLVRTIIRKYAPLSIGFAAWYICSNWMGSFSYDVEAWWFSKSLCYLIGIPGALLLWLATKRSSRNVILVMDTVAAAIQVATIVCCGFVDARQPILAGAITSAFALVTCWLMVQWTNRYANMSPVDAAGAFIVALVVISLVKLVICVVGFEYSSAFAATAPLLSVSMLHVGIEYASKERTKYVYGANEIASLWPMALSVAVFFLVWSWLNATLKITTGHYSFGIGADRMLTGLSYALLIALSVFLYWWMLARGRKLDVSLVWRFSFVFVGVALALSISVGIVKPLQIVTGPVAVIGELLLWVTLVDIARQSIYPAPVIVLLGMLLYIIPDTAARLIIGGLSGNLDARAIASYSLLSIVLVLAFFLPQRSPDADRLLLGAARSQAARNHDDDINTVCHSLAERHGLSNREEDVLALLCRGRSKPYIAETLFISENTVRSHVKRIYLKLDVHSKQDLIDIVASERTDA